MEQMKRLLLAADPAGELRALVNAGTLHQFEPTLSALKMEIPRGYRHKDNLEHSIRVLGNAVELEEGTPDLTLRTAALFHDIGKPKTRRFEGHGVVTFRAHEVVGSRMVPAILKRHGYGADDVTVVKRIVALHMRSHGFDDAQWTDSAVRRLLTDAVDGGTMERLMVVFKADCTTRHESKRRARFRSVDALQAEVDRVATEDARKARRPAVDGHRVMELLGLGPGRELGAVMKFLNTEDALKFSVEEAEAEVLRRFS